MVADLTGLPVANASMLDEGTAAAEGMALAHRVSKRKEPGTFLIDADTLPQTIEVVRTRAIPLGIEVVTADLSGGLPDGDFFGVLLQYPGASGAVRDLAPVIAQAHERGAKAVVAADLLALTLLRRRGVGRRHRRGLRSSFGVPYGFGGPHAGYMAVGEGIQRQLPGRLVGVSVDADGATAYRLALQTREQHIRREKATSNICTAQVLLAVMAGMYAVYHGPEGLAAIAQRTHRRAAEIAAGLRSSGVEVVHGAFFDTVLARVPGRAAEVAAAARERGINLRPDGPDHVGIACDENTLPEHVTAVLEAFGAAPAPDAAEAIPDALRRERPYLTHPVFHAHRSKPRCCATCAASRTRTSRSTAP